MATEVEKLRTKLAKAEAEEKKDVSRLQAAMNAKVIGKCFKYVSNGHNTQTITYIKVLDFVRYKDGKLMYGLDHTSLLCEDVSLTASKPGYVIQHGDIRYLGTYQNTRLPIRKHYTKDVVIGGDNRYAYGYASITEIIERPGQTPFYKFGSYNNFYLECSEAEYISAMETCLAVNALTREKMKPLLGKELKTFDYVQEIALADKKLLEELLVKINDKTVNLKDMITIAKKTRNFYQFTDNKLSDLTQSRVYGDDTGMKLTIEGGDGGTDYEPYITCYNLLYVDIEWEKVLYLLRHKLDSVLKTAADLRAYKAIYNTNNWNLTWSGSYDATFEGAVLLSSTLAGVNAIIKKHLK